MGQRLCCQYGQLEDGPHLSRFNANALTAMASLMVKFWYPSLPTLLVTRKQRNMFGSTCENDEKSQRQGQHNNDNFVDTLLTALYSSARKVWVIVCNKEDHEWKQCNPFDWDSIYQHIRWMTSAHTMTSSTNRPHSSNPITPHKFDSPYWTWDTLVHQCLLFCRVED